jgi:hypothetical protein
MQEPPLARGLLRLRGRGFDVSPRCRWRRIGFLVLGGCGSGRPMAVGSFKLSNSVVGLRSERTLPYRAKQLRGVSWPSQPLSVGGAARLGLAYRSAWGLRATGAGLRHDAVG